MTLFPRTERQVDCMNTTEREEAARADADRLAERLVAAHAALEMADEFISRVRDWRGPHGETRVVRDTIRAVLDADGGS